MPYKAGNAAARAESSHMSNTSSRNVSRARAGTTEAPWVRYTLITVALLFVGLFLVMPLAAVLKPVEVEVDVRPEISLPNPADITIEVPSAEVTDDDVNAGIAQVQRVGVALGAVTENGDLLAIEHGEIRILLIPDSCCHM